MAAIEYGSFYWCVILNGNEANGAEESIHLHADSVTVEANGGLTFHSLGRRPAGTAPKDDGSGKGFAKAEKPKTEEAPQTENKTPNEPMVYMAFARGTWRIFYAAKLQDGSPASVEHWNRGNASTNVPESVPRNSGANKLSSQETLRQ
jgi:hypothetical protein